MSRIVKLKERLIGSRSMFYYCLNRIAFIGKKIKLGNNVVFNGVIYVKNKGECIIGNDCIINSSLRANPIGCGTKVCIRIGNDGSLKIGNGCKLSNAAFICDNSSINIGNYVHIGSGAKFYATDFHSMNPYERAKVPEDPNLVTRGPISIKDHAFIGANVFVLKNITIGENSIVGAGSVVTKSIPDNEVWAGNPAKKIKDLSMDEFITH